MRRTIVFALLVASALTLTPPASAGSFEAPIARHAVAAWDSLVGWLTGWLTKEGVSLDPLGGKTSSAYDPNGKTGPGLIPDGAPSGSNPGPDGRPAGGGTDPDGYFHGPDILIDGHYAGPDIWIDG